jgi:hypothetical protein
VHGAEGVEGAVRGLDGAGGKQEQQEAAAAQEAG